MNNNGPKYEQRAYLCQIISQQLGAASTGTTQFSFEFEILETGDKRTCYIPLTDRTMDFAVEGLKSIGFDKTSVRFLDPNVDGFHDFAGQEVEMYCKHETYKGQTNEKWRISSPRGGPVDSNKLRDLDNLFGRAMRNAGGGSAPAPPPRRTPYSVPVTPGGITDDDVPF